MSQREWAMGITPSETVKGRRGISSRPARSLGWKKGYHRINLPPQTMTDLLEYLNIWNRYSGNGRTSSFPITFVHFRRVYPFVRQTPSRPDRDDATK